MPRQESSRKTNAVQSTVDAAVYENLMTAIDLLRDEVAALRDAVDEMTMELEWRNNNLPPANLPPPFQLKSMSLDPTASDFKLNTIGPEDLLEEKARAISGGDKQIGEPPPTQEGVKADSAISKTQTMLFDGDKDVDANVDSTPATPQQKNYELSPVKEGVLSLLSKNNGPDLTAEDIRQRLGFTEFDPTAPLKNPVHRALKELHHEGRICVTEPTWGKACFRLPLE